MVRPGAVLRWGRGHLPPDSLVAPRAPKMLQNPNFPGLHPGPCWGAYSAPQTPWRGGTLPPAKNPTTALGPLGLVSTGLMGLTHDRVGNHTNDRFQM